MTTTTPPLHVLPSGTIDAAAFAFNVVELADLARQAEHDDSEPLHLCDGLRAAFTDMANDATRLHRHPAMHADMTRLTAAVHDAVTWPTMAVALDALAARLHRIALAELIAEVTAIVENRR